MPKSYSEQEREIIKDKLKTESRQLFSQYGIKKTTVDEIVKRVKIPKGAFYLFYQSKELLLFDIIMEEQALIQSELIKAVGDMGRNITKERFSALIFELFKRTTESFLFPIFTSGEYEVLLRKLPTDALNQNISEDDKSIERLFSLIPEAKNKDMSVYSGAFRGIVLLALHKSEVGENIFDDTLKLLIDGLTEKLFEVDV